MYIFCLSSTIRCRQSLGTLNKKKSLCTHLFSTESSKIYLSTYTDLSSLCSPKLCLCNIVSTRNFSIRTGSCTAIEKLFQFSERDRKYSPKPFTSESFYLVSGCVQKYHNFPRSLDNSNRQLCYRIIFYEYNIIFNKERILLNLALFIRRNNSWKSYNFIQSQK